MTLPLALVRMGKIIIIRLWPWDPVEQKAADIPRGEGRKGLPVCPEARVCLP